MNNKSWINLFFIVLAAHLAGILFYSWYNDVQRKGGRIYKIALRENIDRNQIRNDLRREFNGETPEIEFLDDNSILRFSTSYLINQRGTEIDSMVQIKLMNGLRNYLPEGISYGMFDSTYKLASQKVLPTVSAREPAWYTGYLYPVLLFAFKALLMPLLLAFFLTSLKGIISPLKKWIVAALLF